MLSRRSFIKSLLASSIGSLVVLPNLGEIEKLGKSSVVEKDLDAREFKIDDWDIKINERPDMPALQIYCTNGNFHMAQLYDLDTPIDEAIKNFMPNFERAKRRAKWKR